MVQQDIGTWYIKQNTRWYSEILLTFLWCAAYEYDCFRHRVIQLTNNNNNSIYSCIIYWWFQEGGCCLFREVTDDTLKFVFAISVFCLVGLGWFFSWFYHALLLSVRVVCGCCFIWIRTHWTTYRVYVHCLRFWAHDPAASEVNISGEPSINSEVTINNTLE